MIFGPQNKDEDEEVVFAEEQLRIDLQVALYKAMEERQVSANALALKMGVANLVVDDMLSTNCLADIRLWARAFHVLGFQCSFRSQTYVSKS